VKDTGTGIPTEDLPYIFDRFWRGDKSRARTEGSSGLGLAITKQLILAHGGTITAESEMGKGTKFTIELPNSIRDKITRSS
jgi:signal transduction histidine kinase